MFKNQPVRTSFDGRSHKLIYLQERFTAQLTLLTEASKKYYLQNQSKSKRTNDIQQL